MYIILLYTSYYYVHHIIIYIISLYTSYYIHPPAACSRSHTYDATTRTLMYRSQRMIKCVMQQYVEMRTRSCWPAAMLVPSCLRYNKQ